MDMRSDRGWNDPPVIHFAEANQGPKKGKLLNKRVAFPINASAGGQPTNAGYPAMPNVMQSGPMLVQGQDSYSYNSPQRMPSGPSYYQQPTDPYYAQQQQPQSEGYSQSNPYMPSGTVEQPQPVQYHQGSSQQPISQMSHDPMSNLDATIRNFHTAMNSIALGTLKKEEIGQSLQILQSSWKQKLSLEIQDITLKLSIALCNGDTAYAESLLSSLNTDHYQSCHEWLSGPSTLLQVAISVKQSGF